MAVDVTRRLEKLAHCQWHRDGDGSHQIWKTPTGATFPVPRHPGDLKPGTLLKILKLAGLSMSLQEFASAKV